MQSAEGDGQRISEVIRGWLGWCPQGSQRTTRALSAPEPGLPVQVPSPASPAAPAPAVTGPVEHRPEYQTNLLLILVLLGGLFYASRLDLIIPFNILSAVLVYFDAKNIHAGEKFKEVSLLGEVATWSPIVWAVAIFIGTFFLLALYLLCREEIYTANN
ncbi:MAG: hypothetical protein WC379_03065 [Methanoregula sp.]